MALVIKKIVDLSHLGDEYKGISFTFRSVPASDLTGIENKRKGLAKDNKSKDNKDNIDLDKLLPFFTEILQKYFLDGKQNEETISKEDIGQLPADGLIECFEILLGNKADPKAPSESTSTSTTTQDEAKK